MKKKLFSLITLLLVTIICFSQFSLLSVFAGAENTEDDLPSYSAYEYLNKFVSDTVNYPDKTEITDFSLSAPWSMKYVNPDNNKDLTTKISVVRNVKPKWTENGFGSTDGIGYYSTSNGNNDNIHTIFHDGKLLINSRYDKKTDFGPRATALRFTAPKSGEIIIKNDGKIKVFSGSPVWAGGVSSVKTRINLNGKTVEGSEQESTDGNKGFDFDEVKLEVKEGDVVDFLAWSESTTYAYTDFAPVISYLKYSESGSGTESGDKPGTEPGSEPGNKPGGSEDAKNNILFSYAAYEYLNKVVEENKAAINDGKFKLTSDSFKASAPWSVAFSAPTGGNPWYSKTIYLKDKFSFVGSGSAGVSKYALTGESSGGNECMFVAFDDGKLVINGSYKANALNGYITSLKFTAPKSGNIELSSETLTCMKDAPYWANTDHTTIINIKKNDNVIKTITVTYKKGVSTGWTVDGAEQADTEPVFPKITDEVKKGDVLTVEISQSGTNNKSCIAVAPVVAYTSVSDNGETEEEDAEASKPKYGATYNAHDILGKLLQETEIDGNEIDQENSVWRVDISFPQWMATGYKGMVYKYFKTVANLKNVPSFARSSLVQSAGSCTVGIPTDSNIIVINPKDAWNSKQSENIEFNIDFVAPATGKAVLYDPDEGIWGGIQGDPYYSYLEKDSAVSKIQVLLNDKVIWPASGEFTQIDNKNPAVDFPRIELNLKTGDVLRLRTQRVGGSGGFGMQLNPTVSYYDGVPQTGASYNGEIITLVALMSVSVLAIFTLVLIQNKKSRTDK